MAAPSKAWICRRSLAGVVGSNPAGGGRCWVLSGRGFCVKLITHAEEFYRVCVRVSECDADVDNEEGLPQKGLLRHIKNLISVTDFFYDTCQGRIRNMLT